MAFSQHKKYESQITISMVLDSSSITAQRVWSRKGYDPEKHTTLYLKPHGQNLVKADPAKWRQAFRNLTPMGRVYVDAHGGAGINFLEGTHGQMVHAENFAKLLKKEILSNATNPSSFLLKESNSFKLRVSLLACEAGLPTRENSYENIQAGQINNSFASALLYYLYKEGINCDIAARLGIVNVLNSAFVNNIRSVRKAVYLNDKDSGNVIWFPHHDLKSKVIYQYLDQSPYQIVRQAYEAKNKVDVWRIRVFFLLGSCVANTTVLEKKRFLQDLMNEFMTKSTNDIYLALMNAIKNPIVNRHSIFLRRGATRTFLVLSQLLAEYPESSAR